MGKALVFDGITVSNPLRTITFAPETAEEWVNNYADVVTLTSGEKSALTTFVDTLMNNNLWGSVRDFFPMLGGLSSYMKSLKRPTNAPNWNAPTNGTTWDSTRNAPYLSLPGLAVGTPLIYDDDEMFDTQNATFIFGCKHARASGGGFAFIFKDYVYGGGSVESILNTLQYAAVVDNTSIPRWYPINTNTLPDEYHYYNGKNACYVFTASFGSDNATLYTKTDNYSNDFINSVSALTKETKRVSFAFGAYYAGEAEAPNPYSLNGIMCSFISMDKAVTQEEANIISDALYTLDESLGRHVDFV